MGKREVIMRAAPLLLAMLEEYDRTEAEEREAQRPVREAPKDAA